MKNWQELQTLNSQLSVLLAKLEKIPAEDESSDDMVSNLQGLVDERQILLGKLLSSISLEDKSELEEQLALTQTFEKQAKVILKHRQDLLHLGRKNKRQINVYKSIGAK